MDFREILHSSASHKKKYFYLGFVDVTNTVLVDVTNTGLVVVVPSVESAQFNHVIHQPNDRQQAGKLFFKFPGMLAKVVSTLEQELSFGTNSIFLIPISWWSQGMIFDQTEVWWSQGMIFDQTEVWFIKSLQQLVAKIKGIKKQSLLQELNSLKDIFKLSYFLSLYIFEVKLNRFCDIVNCLDFILKGDKKCLQNI